MCYILFSIFNISLSTPLTLKYPANHKFKFSFGSCNKFYEDDNSTIFNAVADYRPDIWAWIGKIFEFKKNFYEIMGWLKTLESFLIKRVNIFFEIKNISRYILIQIFLIGDAAYIEDMEIFYFGFSYPGAEVAKRRF